jgi:hypothetical protein
VIWKRTIAATVGVSAVLVSAIAFAYAILVWEDFKDPAVPLRFAVFENLIVWSIAVIILGVGVRFLRFAWSGRSRTTSYWMRVVLLGIGLFFLGFIASLPFTFLWANHKWAGEAQGSLPAIEVSFYIRGLLQSFAASYCSRNAISDTYDSGVVSQTLSRTRRP